MSQTNCDRGTPSLSATSSIDFLTLVSQLKVTKRTGWVRAGVTGPESIADHMYRMGLMALISSPPGVDRDRCVKLAIVHDLAEAIVGDITPSDNVSKTEKAKREADAMAQIRALLGSETAVGQEVEHLFQEYEDGATPEAQLVKDFDKLEMILQAHEYETTQNIRLQDFFDSTRGKFQTDIGKAWAAEICQRRQQHLANQQHS
ncbi:hypothetical protein WJX72_008370 [[Myrmecia] bisecta]|uniref:5'-deoxynucleotidase n=1 Tax=[Myrmecia] bisecta TaxID=41462 RepID=A0AAW1PL37_9CHLO